MREKKAAGMLKRLVSKKELAILGINSGTSADGVDLALIRFSVTGRKPRITYIDGDVVSYSPAVKTILERVIRTGSIDKEEWARLDGAYGDYLGKAAAKFISGRKHTVDLIASHGQTVGHYPLKKALFGSRLSATHQIGDGNALAVVTNLPVVSDFRRADIASGGEGAPLTPFVNQMLFGDSRRSRIIVNIGGIANYSYHPAGGRLSAIRGGDCGPGNILSDLATRLLFHKPYDRDGALARKGQIVPELITPIRKANGKRGVSAGREQFDIYLLARLVHMARRLKAGKHDIIASIGDATARLIYSSIKSGLTDKRLDGVYLTGGGRRNIFMVERLQKLCSPVKLWPIEALGYDGDLLEAVSFAVLGGCFVHGISSALPQITGGGGIAGRLSLPPGVK